MSALKKIPVVGSILGGIVPGILGESPKLPDTPAPPPPPPAPVEDKTPVTAMPDPEDVAAKKRKQREAAAANQTGKMSTILSDGSGSQKLGG